MNEIKVYEMDDCTWYAAETAEDASRAYTEDTSGDLIPEEGYPRELTAEDMERLTFVTDLYNPEQSESMTFAEALTRQVAEGKEFPCFFATTEF